MGLVQKSKLVMCIVAIFTICPPLGAQEKVLTLEQCYQLALKNNIDIAVAEYSKDIAEGELLEAKNPFDVYLTGSYEYVKTDAELREEQTGSFKVGVGKYFVTGTQLAIGYGMDYKRSSLFESLSEVNSAVRDLQSSQGNSLSNLVDQINDSLEEIDENRTRIDIDNEIETLDRSSREFDPILDFDSLYTSGVTLKLTQSLLRNFGITANTAQIKAAEINKKVADYQLQQQVNGTLAQVEGAYWAWVFAAETCKIWEKSIEEAKRYVVEVESKASKVEDVLPSDVNDAKVNQYNREIQLIALQKELKVQSDRLKRQIYPFDPKRPQQFKWDETYQVPQQARQAFMAMEEPNASIENAYKYRPDLKQLQEKMKSLDILIARNKNQLLPTLDVYASGTLLGQDDSLGSSFGKTFSGDYRWSVGVSLEVPLGNFGARGRLHQAKYQQAQAVSSLHKTQYDIALEVQEALREVHAAREKYAKTIDSVSNAEQRLVSMERRYENPLSRDYNLVFFLQDAEYKRTQAKILKNQALLEYKLAMVQLKMAEARYIKEIYPRYRNKAIARR